MPHVYLESMLILAVLFFSSTLVLAFTITPEQVEANEYDDKSFTGFQSILLKLAVFSFWYAVGLSFYVVIEKLGEWLC